MTTQPTTARPGNPTCTCADTPARLTTGERLDGLLAYETWRDAAPADTFEDHR